MVNSTKEKLIEEAKIRFPEGTKIKGLGEYSGYISWKENSFPPYVWSGDSLYLQVNKSHRAEIYKRNEWAEILEYPPNYQPKEVELINELYIW